MIRSGKVLEAFEKKMLTDPRIVPSPEEAMRIYQWLWEEACALGDFPPEDYLADLEADPAIASTLRLHGENS